MLTTGGPRVVEVPWGVSRAGAVLMAGLLGVSVSARAQGSSSGSAGRAANMVTYAIDEELYVPPVGLEPTLEPF